ncbi:prominin-2 isoform X2 [Mastacembelus armatus]|uniref:Prominin 2 n=1 Tax=Mastacembelus armatus TaxID=205130 RepID=A0A3Q3L1M3_9TELE|nr:prominin-1-A-like isoform X2 [Mastacembelus armatus]
MGLCENTMIRRWQGSHGAFRAGVEVMLLGLSLAQSVLSQAPCLAAEVPKNFTQPRYRNITLDPSVGFMAPLVHSFLGTVQPKPFPGDLIQKSVTEFQQFVQNKENIKQVLVYEIGFLVCVAIGILYILLMPIVGLCLACCRCCGNCGGKMYQKQTSSIDCRRRTLYWSAFVTTVIILAGNICMFKSNEAFKVSVDHGPEQLSSIIFNVDKFLTDVPQQVNSVVNESNNIIQRVRGNLDGIGVQLGKPIQQKSNDSLGQMQHSVRLLDQATRNVSLQLNQLDSSLAHLQSTSNSLQANVTAVRNRINQTLLNPNCFQCETLSPGLAKLTLDTSFNIPSLSELRSAVDKVVKMNLSTRITEVENYFNSIPLLVTNQTKDLVQISKRRLGDIETQISKFTSDIPLPLLNMLGTLDQVQGEISRFTPEVKRAEHIRWSVCIVLCCVVLLVVVCNVLGLVMGPLGLTSRADPAKRSCTADCGGTFLMMGAGFSFLFSWLFMILVVLLFLLGGNVYTLLCRPWNNGQLLKFFDTLDINQYFDRNQHLKMNLNLSISGIYRDCEKNQPLWTTLHLYDLINLGDLLNVSNYIDQIQQQFENTNINFPPVTFLSPEVKNQLSSFSTNATIVDTTVVTQWMNNISSINLNTTADQLDNPPEYITDNDTINEFKNEASDLRQLQANIETTIIPQVESRKFLNCQLSYFTVFADWANLTITQQLGRCRPLAEAVDSAETILCSHMVESLNAFWFSLGWCMMFFIPSIIFSIKLAKYYRRMKYSDVYDNHIIMNHIPRAQMNIT